jgi:hypothetical protein
MVAGDQYYHFVTIIEPQYNYLASKDRNGSGRSGYYHFVTIIEPQYNYLASKVGMVAGDQAITISLQ